MDLFNSPAFTKHVAELMEEWHVPGLAIAIIQNGSLASRGYGKAGNGKAVTADTCFDIASSSKSLTAAAVALIVADDEKHGQVQWDTPVSKLLPEDFALASQEYTNSVTVEDILSHRTGLPRHDFCSLSPRAEHPDTPRSITRNLRHLDLAAPIRSKFFYNNLMFTAAAHLVENLSGRLFGEFLKTHIFDPLRMSSTTLQSKNALEAGLEVAQPYKWDKTTSTYVPVEMQDSPEAVGAGLIITSVNDYSRWVSALMNQDEPVSSTVYEGLLKPRTVEEADDLAPFTSPVLYCAGLTSYYYRGCQVVSHDGSDPGLATTHFFLPQMKFGGVIFGNSSGAGSVHNVLSHELIDEVLKIPKEERVDWNLREREAEEKYARREEEENEDRRKELCPEADGHSHAQPGSLDLYTGRYWHEGYRAMEVEVNKNDRLFIDASDRTMGFTLELEHLCHGTKYIAHMRDYYEGDAHEIAAEFIFEDERVVWLGIDLEDDLASRRIWFRKTDKVTKQ